MTHPAWGRMARGKNTELPPFKQRVAALKYVASLMTVSKPTTLAGTSFSSTGPMLTATAMSFGPCTRFQTRSMSGVESMNSVLGTTILQLRTAF